MAKVRDTKEIKESVLEDGRVKREYVREDGYKVEDFLSDGYTQRVFPLGEHAWMGYIIPDYLEDPEKLEEYINKEKEKLKRYILSCRSLTAEELATKKVVEEIKEGWLDSADKVKVARRTENLKREFIQIKDKYKGVTDDELDEYVDIVIRGELLSASLRIMNVEDKLWASKNVSRSYRPKDVYNIEDIRQIEKDYNDDIKEVLEGLKKMALWVSGIEGSLTAGLVLGTAGTFTIETALRSIAYGSMGFGVGLGVISVLFGVPHLVTFLIKKLQDKKFVDELKKNGTYEMVLEYTEKLKRMAELEKKGGKSK